MNLILTVYNALCEPSKFTVNGVDADYDDFGDKGDTDPDNAEEYGCGNMTFTPKLATDSILSKYGITLDDYNEIARQLQEDLSFGNCGWCT